MYSEDSSPTFGLTALQLAAGHNRTEFVEKLLTVPGLMVDPKTDHGVTPLFSAASLSFVEILKKLHEAGADIHAMSNEGLMPIQL